MMLSRSQFALSRISRDKPNQFGDQKSPRLGLAVLLAVLSMTLILISPSFAFSELKLA